MVLQRLHATVASAPNSPILPRLTFSIRQHTSAYVRLQRLHATVASASNPPILPHPRLFLFEVSFFCLFEVTVASAPNSSAMLPRLTSGSGSSSAPRQGGWPAPHTMARLSASLALTCARSRLSIACSSSLCISICTFVVVK